MFEGNQSKEVLTRLKECEHLRARVKDRTTDAYLGLLDSMRNDYETIKDEKNLFVICKEIEQIIVNRKRTTRELSDMLLASYDSRARFGDFRAYCIALEWNRSVEKQFFIPRKRVLEKHGLIQAMQDMADDKLDFLFISLAPRVGKSTLGLFFLTFMAGRFPDRSILANGHSTSLTQSFYQECCNIMTSEEYRFGQIFPGIEIVKQSAEYSWIDLKSEKRFHTLSFRSVDSGTTGIVEASNILYCDDLVKDIEQANSPDRLQKLFDEYTSTIQDRKIQRLCKDGVYRPCPEIHVATRWSLLDPIGRLIAIYGKEENERMRIINVPCYDENGESNFMYDYGKGFDKEYYHHLEMAEDPVTFAAKYLGKPIEREGRPFTEDQLTFFYDLPEEEPDRIIAYSDVAHGGEDYYSMPIGYQYGFDIYIEDVLFVNKLGDTSTRPLVCNKLIQHKVTRAGFEENNGGKLYADWIVEDLRKRKYKCNITTHKVPTTKSKLDRIMGCQNEIKGIAVEKGDYRIFFKAYEKRKDNKEYSDFMKNLTNWSQKTGAIQKSQHDDAPDSLAGMVSNILTGQVVGRASSKISLDKYGL